MSRLPIRLRLTLVFALVMAVVFAAVGAILYVRLADTLDERIADTLEGRTTALASTLDPGSAVVTGDEGVAQVLDADGAVVAGSSTAAGPSSLLTTSQFERARSGSITVDRDEYRLRATPLDDGVIVVGEPFEDRDETLRGMLAQLFIVLPIALLASSAIGYFVAGAALRPVERMRVEAEAISASEPERRLPLPAAHDEIFRLGETLNEMLDRLGTALERERAFVADASHELRTPLALLKTELELALRKPRTAEELELSLRSAAEETDRLVRLAEDLLLVARADQGRLPIRTSRVRVRELLALVAGRFEHRAEGLGRGVAVSADDELELVADPVRLEQALDNLVDNALRHGGGTVRLVAEARGGLVELHVLDEGDGFPPAFVPRAFERFSRADEARGRGGSGLGLALVDVIAQAHGGTVQAANRDGHGADVWLSLPAA